MKPVPTKTRSTNPNPNYTIHLIWASFEEIPSGWVDALSMSKLFIYVVPPACPFY